MYQHLRVMTGNRKPEDLRVTARPMPLWLVVPVLVVYLPIAMIAMMFGRNDWAD